MEMMVEWYSPYEQKLLMDIAADSLDFSGSESADPEIYVRALRALYRYVSRGRKSAQYAIGQYMVFKGTQKFLKMVTCITIRLAQLLSSNIPEWDTFFLPPPQLSRHNECSFKSDAVLHIINSFVEIAETNSSFLYVILEANILGLLRPFLQQQLRDPRYRMAQHSGDELLVYDTVDSEILLIIREHGLRGVSPSMSTGNPSFFDVRRTIVSHALNVGLGRKNILDQAEGTIDDIENKPVAFRTRSH